MFTAVSMHPKSTILKTLLMICIDFDLSSINTSFLFRQLGRNLECSYISLQPPNNRPQIGTKSTTIPLNEFSSPTTTATHLLNAMDQENNPHLKSNDDLFHGERLS